MADPRLLGSFGYEDGRIPPSQDQFAGQQIKSQPSIVENILHWFNNPTDPGIGPTALEAPVAGMVMNERNAGIIKSIMKYWMQKQENPDDATVAWNFINAKYPRFSKLAKLSRYESGDPNLLGSHVYDPQTNTSKIYLTNTKRHDLNSMVDTIAHELNHARQATKDPIGLQTAYIPSTVNFKRYQNQSWEKFARQAGNTAEMALEKFKSFLPKLNLDEQVANLPDFAGDVLHLAYDEQLKGVEKYLTDEGIKQTTKNFLNNKLEYLNNHLLYPQEYPLSVKEAMDHVGYGLFTDFGAANPALKNYMAKKGFLQTSEPIKYTNKPITVNVGDIMRKLAGK